MPFRPLALFVFGALVAASGRAQAPAAPSAPDGSSLAGARPVAGGQIAPAAPGEPAPFSDHYGYEVWRSEDGAVWVDLIVNPPRGTAPGETAPTVRLPSIVLHGLALAASRHDGTPTVRSVGVGVSEGALSMTLTQRWPLAILTVLLAASVLLVGLAAWGLRSRRRARTLATVAHHQAVSREDERARLAREIHDGPIQDLVQLAVALGGVVEPEPSHVARRLQEVGRGLRSLAAGLRPPALDHLGLAAALDDLAERWAGAPTPLDVQLSCDRLPPLRPEAELAIYRIVQEALTNSTVHGHARVAWVFVRVQDHRRPHGLSLEVVVRDDGRGLPSHVALGPRAEGRLAAAGHFGLVGMAERAREFGASLTLSPGPDGSGTEVRLVASLDRLARSPVPTPAVERGVGARSQAA